MKRGYRSPAGELRRKIASYEQFRELNKRRFTQKNEHYEERLTTLRKELEIEEAKEAGNDQA